MQLFKQDGLVPPMDREAADIITGSEHILKAYASKHSLNASAINDLIKDVLQNPDFNSDEGFQPSWQSGLAPTSMMS